MQIEYIFEFDKLEKISFLVDTERELIVENTNSNEYIWTQLEYHKCPNCSLKGEKYCPAALDIQKIFEYFSDLASFERIDVTVIAPQRTYKKNCDAQSALISLTGLIMATGKCPILSKMKPMAEFHLPFSTFEESLIRTISFYLIKQYLKKQDNEVPDYDLIGLTEHYRDLILVNTFLKQRLDNNFTNDANINTISSYFSLSALIERTLDEQLEDVRHYFESI